MVIAYFWSLGRKLRPLTAVPVPILDASWRWELQFYCCFLLCRFIFFSFTERILQCWRNGCWNAVIKSFSRGKWAKCLNSLGWYLKSPAEHGTGSLKNRKNKFLPQDWCVRGHLPRSERTCLKMTPFAASAKIWGRQCQRPSDDG